MTDVNDAIVEGAASGIEAVGNKYNEVAGEGAGSSTKALRH
jgi:hypothetical protein